MIEEIKKKTNIEETSPENVLRTIPTFHSKLIEEYNEKAKRVVELKRDYERVYAQTLEYYKFESDTDIDKLFKVRDDREVYMRQNSEELKRVQKELDETKHEAKEIEGWIDYLKTLMQNIRTILDYEKFRAGK